MFQTPSEATERNSERRALLEKWLRGPRLKVARARAHIDEFNAKTENFLARNPFRIVVQENTGKHRDKWPRALVFQVREEIPEEFSAVIGDVVHNLRSALDLLVCALVRANNQDDKHVYFPVAQSAETLDEAIKNGKVKRAGPSVVEFVRNLNPYRGDGGDWVISALHDLDILDKHRLIIAIGCVGEFQRVVVGLRWESSIAVTLPGFQWAGLEDGAKMLDIRAEPDLELGTEFPAAFSIAFGFRQPVGGLPIIDNLGKMADHLEAIVNSFAVRDVEVAG